MSARDCDLFLWTLTVLAWAGMLVSSRVLSSEVRDWGPASPATLVAASLARLLVSVPCSSGNTDNLDLTKLCGKPDLGQIIKFNRDAFQKIVCYVKHSKVIFVLVDKPVCREAELEARNVVCADRLEARQRLEAGLGSRG